MRLGWSGRAMVQGRPINLDNSRARAYCALGAGCPWKFLSHPLSTADGSI